MKEKNVVPSPSIMESMRFLGYSFENAVADIIDNSVAAGADYIQLEFSSREPQFLCIIDNGHGMSEDELETAMRYGSRNQLNPRNHMDLGRFGLGLKTASSSQCRKLTVVTKREGKLSAACWDLDHTLQSGEWILQSWSGDEVKKLQPYKLLESNASGTAVLWQNFDRLKQETSNAQSAFDEKIQKARTHISLVFHRFLKGEPGLKPVNIFFNGDPVRALDPFLTQHPATQQLYEQKLQINGEEILVKPYILPFASKLTSKDIQRIEGTDDLRENQGFYVYRNKRLIIWGTWFRITRQNEIKKLVRIKVDIPNTLDSIWDIDIKKSRASLPSIIRDNLRNIVSNAIIRSDGVYRYRGRKLRNDALTYIWEPMDERGCFRYRINRSHPIYKTLEDTLQDKHLNLLDSFVGLLEESFPYADSYYRLAQNEAEMENSIRDVNKIYELAEKIIGSMQAADISHLSFLKNIDHMDPFEKYPAVVAKIREKYDND